MNQPARTAAGSPRPGPAQPRIAILVLGCLLPVYDRCIKVIRATWGALRRDGVDVFYVYGGHATPADPAMVGIEALIGRPRPEVADYEVGVYGDVILCGAADVYYGQPDCILRKRLAAFGYLAREARYDFVYTVCATSYVDVDVLRRYVDGLPVAGVYHGPLSVYPPSGTPFVSGASMLLSADLAAALAGSARAIVAANDPLEPDDVAIGRWIAANCCTESPAEIRRRMGSGRKATDNQTFVVPSGGGMVDFVEAPAHTQVPEPSAYHYHFHSRRIWEMEQFHRRFFVPPAPSGPDAPAGASVDQARVKRSPAVAAMASISRCRVSACSKSSSSAPPCRIAWPNLRYSAATLRGGPTGVSAGTST